jgi:hypothetical protein
LSVRAQTVDELKQLCSGDGLPAAGARQELIDRLDSFWGSDRQPGCPMWDAAEEGVLGQPMTDADRWDGECSVCNGSVGDVHTRTDVACCSMCNYVCHKQCLGASETKY